MLDGLRPRLIRAVCACVCAGMLPSAHTAEPVPAPVPVKMLEAAVPDYPPDARRKGDEGTVHVRVRVLASGEVGEARIQRSSGFRTLDEAAVAATMRSRFRPAQNAAGAAVDSWVVVPYRFVLQDAPSTEPTRKDSGSVSPSRPEPP